MTAIKFDFLVEMEGGEAYEVVADQRDLSRFEMEDFYTPRKHTIARYLAWAASKRQGLTKLGWPEFNALCVEVGDQKPEAEPLDPGQPEPRTESSSRSSGAPAAE
jgi:hypothetical protein